jgi:hypothetical protein
MNPHRETFPVYQAKFLPPTRNRRHWVKCRGQDTRLSPHLPVSAVMNPLMKEPLNLVEEQEEEEDLHIIYYR